MKGDPEHIVSRDRRTVDREWLRAGGRIEKVHRTGENRYVHPRLEKIIVVNARRESANVRVLIALNRLRREEA